MSTVGRLHEEIDEYRTRARERDLSEEAAKELERQVRRLERTHPDSAESSVIRAFTGTPCSEASAMVAATASGACAPAPCDRSSSTECAS